MTLGERLLKYSIPEPNSGCLLWLGTVNDGGYARMRIKGRQLLAHRVAYEQAKGPIPAGLLVCHKCDVPGCVNPDHLFLGTHEENMADMVAKGRAATSVRGDASKLLVRRGEENPSARLTEEIVLAIRATKGTCREISRLFGISESTIHNIISRRHWRHI